MKGTHTAARSVASHPDHRNRSWRQSTQNRRNDTLTDPVGLGNTIRVVTCSFSSRPRLGLGYPIWRG